MSEFFRQIYFLNLVPNLLLHCQISRSRPKQLLYGIENLFTMGKNPMEFYKFAVL